MKLLLVSALLGCLATAYAVPAEGIVRWCVKSDQELKKCHDLAAKVALFSCVKRDSSIDCIKAIKDSEADAITLDGGDIYTAGLPNYDLQPIIAEDYGEGKHLKTKFKISSTFSVKLNMLYILFSIRLREMLNLCLLVNGRDWVYNGP
uniref:Transferrin-like domain-containing protein n=1 Tax=Hucho hucho TaxID=62062 RepID=A0A4W5NWD1_9TELE